MIIKLKFSRDEIISSDKFTNNSIIDDILDFISNKKKYLIKILAYYIVVIF